MGTLFRISIKKILIFAFALALFGCVGASKSSVQNNEQGINEAYLGCLMFNNDNNGIQKCSDLRWGAEEALYNNIKTPSSTTIKDLKKATPPTTGKE
ncbi:MAG: hypothetical protein ACM3SR_11660 [Ignavibacteriales bacterium]